MLDQLKQEERMYIAAHRGYSAKYPENTLLAFNKALEYDVDMIEFDLRLTKDGEVVILHDKTVNRTTDGSGNVQDFTLQELTSLNAGKGEKIPTLRELCEIISTHPQLLLNVEIKSQDIAQEVVDQSMTILQEYHLVNRSIFTSFDADILHYLVDRYQVNTQGFPKSYMKNFKDGQDGTLEKMTAVAIEMKHLTPELVQMYKEAGKLVWSYCPDDEEAVRHCMECGVSLVTCNEILPALTMVKNG